ncbi:MAG: PD-(D/E)XK nuclease family protein, partial [Bacteroidales bacterium]|nr:PD-(D/E)XK nuclease family protein [Bacteroidales bacterium]
LTFFPNELAQDAFNNFNSNKNIRIIKTPNEIAQAKLCGELLQDLDSTRQYESTAIILADEKLVVPVIKSLPVDKYNVTLGYPIRSSAAYTLFESMLSLYANKRNNNLYYKDVLKICENPLIPTTINGQIKALRDDIIKNKKITIQIDDCGDTLDFIFQLDTTIERYVKNLSNAIINICKTFALNEIDKSILYTIYTQLSVAQKITKDNYIQFQKIEFINNLLKKTLQSKNVAIEGQPLVGLQVLGILETRLLDFENIILTSVMDGNLPKTSLGSSFIPYNLRVAFGMPTIKEQSAMYSYYFYRTLQRSHNITLLYSENSGENKSEQSRFLLQLLYESPFKTNLGNGEEQNKDKVLDKIIVEEYNYNVLPNNVQSISIDKNNPDVQAYFDSLKNGKYLAPTAIIKYIECSLQFYFSQIKGLKKPQEFDELPKPYDVGNYFHYTMENLYKDLEGQKIDAQVIDKILANGQKLDEIILLAMKKGQAPQKIIDPRSKEFLTTKKQIQTFLEYEKQNPFTLIKVENQDAKIKFH